MFHFKKIPADLAASFLCFATFVAPLSAAELGGGNVQTVVGVRADYDSNIFLNNRDVSDTVATATATVNYVRDVALVATDASVGVIGTVFADRTEQNSLDPFVRGTVTYSPSDKTIATVGTSFRRSSLANEILNERTKSDEFLLDGSLQHLFSGKLGYRLTGGHRNSQYLSPGYADVLSYSMGANAVYVYSPKLTMVTGYTHRESWTENRPVGAPGGPASRDARISVGFEGALAPKVSGTFNVGWVRRRFESNAFDDSSALFLSTGFKWIPREKTSVTVNASQDFDLTAASQSSKTSSLTLGVNQVIDEKWNVDGSTSFSHSTFDGALAANDRRDDNFRVKARATYAWTTNVSIEFSIGYGNVDSTNIFSTYDRVNAGVGITASF